MATLRGVLVSTELSVARRAHVFSIVLSSYMRTLRDFHHFDLVEPKLVDFFLFLLDSRSVVG